MVAEVTPRKTLEIQNRLANFANHWLIPVVMASLLIADFIVGIIWVASPANSFSSPVYDKAQALWSMDAYGAVMIVSALLAAVATTMLGRSWLTGWVCGPLLGGQWLFWSILFTAGALGRPGATFVLAVFASLAAILHCLAGLGLAVHPQRPQRRATDPGR